MKQIFFFLSFCILSLFLTSSTAKTYIPKSDLIHHVFQRVKYQYVDPKRLKPLEMFKGALENMSRELAPVVIDIETKKKEIIIVNVDESQQTFRFSKLNNINELEKALQKVVQYIKLKIDSTEKLETVDYASINGFLQTLDPHTNLLIPQIYSNFNTDTQGNFGGVGMVVGIQDGNLSVISPINGTPAHRAGLKAKDKIIQINDESAINMDLQEAVSKLRGKKGTTVDIYIMREGFTTPKKFVITRDIIEIKSVSFYVFEGDQERIGYIHLKKFQKNSLEELNKALDEIDPDLSDFKGLILDLRNNPGGLLDQAIRISDRFLSSGNIVSTTGLDPRSKIDYKANWFNTLSKIPIVVITNKGSASASEIVAAALKNNDRALIIGDHTFGKGSVQQLFPLKGGSALKLTTSKYLTPGNESIQSVGVTPHIHILPFYVTKDFIRILPFKGQQGEASLEQNFSEWGTQQEKPIKTLHYLYKEQEDTSGDKKSIIDVNGVNEKELSQDYFVNFARRILQNSSLKTSKLINDAVNYADEEETQQAEHVTEKLKTFDIKWVPKEIKATSKLNIKTWLEVADSPKNPKTWTKIKNEVTPNSKIRLFIEVQNVGKHEIPQLSAVGKSEILLFNQQQFVFGNLQPKQSQKWYVPIFISQSSIAKNVLIDFSFIDGNQKTVHEQAYTLTIKPHKRPRFSYEITAIENGSFESIGNKDQMIQNKETIALEVAVKNISTVKSNNVTVLLKNGEGKDIYLNKGRVSIKSLKPNEIKKVYFNFNLKNIPTDQDLDFSLDLFDSEYNLSSINHKIKIPVLKKIETIKNEAPKIQMISNNLTSKSQLYNLSGKITDDKTVKDMYIFVNQKKVFYQNFSKNKNQKLVSFAKEINLDEEVNFITIVARDQQEVRTQEIMNIRKID